MAYSDFDLRTAVQTFGLIQEEHTDLFQAVAPLEPSDYLRTWLNEFAPLALGINSEMARSTYIITPVLVESKRQAGATINVLPGVAFEVDPAKGLTGFCDYLIVRSAEMYYLRGPILAVVEAKRDNLIAGLGQCVAEMVGIRLFNEREGTAQAAVFGCVTSGSNWRFLKLEGTKLFIDQVEYYLRDVAKILGILVSIARGDTPPDQLEK